MTISKFNKTQFQCPLGRPARGWYHGDAREVDNDLTAGLPTRLTLSNKYNPL